MRCIAVFVAMTVLLAPQLNATEHKGTLDQIKESGKVRVGFRESEPPMSFLDKQGKPAGYSIDLCTRIVNEVKNELKNPDILIEFVPVRATNRFDAVANNSIDILCGSTTKTISRGKLVDFTQLTFVTGASLLTLESGEVEDMSALQGKKVAVTKNTTTLEALSKMLKESVSDAQIVQVDTASAGLEALLKGEVDAFSADQVVLIGLVLTHDGPEKFAITGDVYSYEPFALAVRRNDSDFRLLADKVLSQLNRSGQIEAYL